MANRILNLNSRLQKVVAYTIVQEAKSQLAKLYSQANLKNFLPEKLVPYSQSNLLTAVQRRLGEY